MLNTIRHILQVKGNDIWMIEPDATVLEALRRMADKDVGALLVFENGKLVGIFSERDYARKIILHGKTSKETAVRDAMTTDFITLHPDQTIHECMEIMNSRRVRHLPIVENDEVIGVVSIGDVVRNIIYNQREEIKNLERQVIFK
jgi:CBS domain-containing protein